MSQGQSGSEGLSQPRDADDPAIGGYSEDQFSAALGQIEQWGRSYVGSIGDREVGSGFEPGAVLKQLAEEPPTVGEGMALWDCVGEELQRVVEPGLMHWQSPGFFGYFPCGSSLPGVMGELASAVLNVNGMLWSTSPGATELEMRMMDWCAELFGLPSAFRFDGGGALGGGCIQGTASEGVLAALCAARTRQVKRGRDRASMCIYTSTQAHSSVVKAAMVAGLADGPVDRSRVRLIETDDQLQMDAGVLMSAIRADLEAGLTPCFVSTTQGTTSTGAFDPLSDIGQLIGQMNECDRPWLHVDAAWAGVAAVCEEHRDVLDGAEFADSICINPHKWLLTSFDCDLFWVRNRDALTDSLSITPEYLRNAQSDAGRVVDYRDWHVPLGRRMRALKLWWVIRYFGRDGLAAHIRHHVSLTQRFDRWAADEPRVRVVFERSLALVCFVAEGEDETTKRLIDWVNARGRVMISHTRVPLDGQDRWVARVAVGSSWVEGRHIDMLIDEVRLGLAEVVE
jgi:aromatic-L-amino-acid decarboxylase